MIIEQAIFLSRSQAENSTVLARRTPGLSQGDAQELALLADGTDARCDNDTASCFVQLESGAFAVGRTTAVPPSACPGPVDQVDANLMSWFLVVGSKAFIQAANNPFTLNELACAQGAMGTGPELPDTLEPLHLADRDPAVDSALLARLARHPGPEIMATLVQAALVSDRLAISTTLPIESLLAGLFSLLPIELRTQFTFATGRKPANSSGVRIAELPRDAASWPALAHQGVTLLNLDEARGVDEPQWQGWAGCVAEILRSGRFSLLCSQLEQHRAWMNLATLPVLAQQIEVELRAISQSKFPRSPGSLPIAGQPGGACAPAGQVQRSDGAHPWRAVTTGAARPAGSGNLGELAAALNGQPPEILDLLERIDDLVFNAIGGDLSAQGELEVLWPVAVLELDENLVEQSREQYLRCALSIWSECVDHKMHEPARAVSAIDVLCVLFGE